MVNGAQERTRRTAEGVSLQGRDGARLHAELLLPEGEPRAAVALSHAMLVDRRTLDQPPGEGLLSQLLAAGAAVLWFDQRGHGKSGPLAQTGASWDYDALVDDAGVVAAYLKGRFPQLPCVAVGHSLFGHVALAWQARASAPWWESGPNGAGVARYDALVLLGANVWLPQLEPVRVRWWAKRLTFLALEASSVGRGYLPVRRLRLGTADEPYEYLRQMGGWLADADWTARDGQSYLRALPCVDVPILSVASVGDRLLAIPECQGRLAGMTRGPVSHITVGYAHGDGCQPDHMGLVLDARMVGVWRRMGAWICGLGR